MCHYNKNNKGFSLIELLVGMVIIVTATTIILSIIVTSFRISSKATVVDNARQNGNYAMSRMVRMIQFADRFNGGNDGSARAINDNDFDFSECDADGQEYEAISLRYENQRKIFQCRDNENSISLITSTNPIVREELLSSENLSLRRCIFICKKVSDSASPVITIRFDLETGGGEVTAEKRSFIPFFTSVTMRNE